MRARPSTLVVALALIAAGFGLARLQRQLARAARLEAATTALGADASHALRRDAIARAVLRDRLGDALERLGHELATPAVHDLRRLLALIATPPPHDAGEATAHIDARIDAADGVRRATDPWLRRAGLTAWAALRLQHDRLARADARLADEAARRLADDQTAAALACYRRIDPRGALAGLRRRAIARTQQARVFELLPTHDERDTSDEEGARRVARALAVGPRSTVERADRWLRHRLRPPDVDDLGRRLRHATRLHAMGHVDLAVEQLRPLPMGLTGSLQPTILAAQRAYDQACARERNGWPAVSSWRTLRSLIADPGHAYHQAASEALARCAHGQLSPLRFPRRAEVALAAAHRAPPADRVLVARALHRTGMASAAARLCRESSGPDERALHVRARRTVKLLAQACRADPQDPRATDAWRALRAHVDDPDDRHARVAAAALRELGRLEGRR